MKQKQDVSTKAVFGIGLICALVFLVNFSLMFNVGVLGLNQQIISEKERQTQIAINNLGNSNNLKNENINSAVDNVNRLEGTNPMSVRVAAVRFHATGPLIQDIELLTSKIQEIINDHGNEVDIIVVPEYSLFTVAAPPPDAIDFSCDENFNNCVMAPGAGSNSQTIIAAIENFRLMTIQNNFYLFLGTVKERLYAPQIPGLYNPPYIYFNDLVIINPQGQIAIKRKVSGSDSNTCMWNNYECQQAALNLTLSTVRSFPVTNRSGELLNVFTTICAESIDQTMIGYAINQGLQDLDLLIHVESQGDIFYQNITQAIQNNIWSPTLPYGWNWGFAEEPYGFIPLFINSGLLRSNAYLVVSDMAQGQAGIINLVNPPAPITEYELTNDYMFGLIQYCADGTIEGQCSVTKPQSCSQRNLINNCSQCGCPAGQGCLADESCKQVPVIKSPYNGNINGN